MEGSGLGLELCRTPILPQVNKMSVSHRRQVFVATIRRNFSPKSLMREKFKNLNDQ